MIRRSLTTLSLLALAAAPLAAQQAQKAQKAQANSDPDKKQAGGALPAGWTGRTDRPNTKLADAKFVTMGSGYHVTSGPSAIYWRPSQNMKGPYTATVSFTQTKKPTHPEAYGIIFRGKKLNAPDQDYAYVLVRGDGKVMVKHRAGTETHTILDWTENAAVKKEDASGKATNVLTIDASKADSVRMLVNGTQVASLPGNGDGVLGLRVNHNLDLHIGEYTVTPKK